MAARPLDLLGRAERSSPCAASLRAEGAGLDGEARTERSSKFTAMRVVVGPV